MHEPHTKPHAFVVDDEHVIATTLAMILRQHGFDATPFSEPLKALEAARTQAPDLLISDVVMPRLSGIDLAIQIREQCPDCRILLFSGQAATVHMLEAAKAGGHDFELMSKPVHPTDLLKRIRKATEGLMPTSKAEPA